MPEHHSQVETESPITRKRFLQSLAIAGAAGAAGLALSQQIIPPVHATVADADPAAYTITNESGTINAYDGNTGSVAYSGTNAATVIQSALDNANGGIVHLKPGFYSAGSSIQGVVLRTNNVSLEGEGIDAVTLDNIALVMGSDIGGAGAPLVKNISLRNLTVDGLNMPNTGSGLMYRNVDNALVDRVRFYRIPFWSIFGDFANVPKSGTLTIRDCILDRAGVIRGQQDMTAFNYLDTLYVHNTRFLNNPGGTTFLPYGPSYSTVNNVYLIGCKFVNNPNSLPYRDILISTATQNAIVSDIDIVNGSVDSEIRPSTIAIVSNVKSNQSIIVGAQYASCENIASVVLKLTPNGNDGTNNIKGRVVASNCPIGDHIEINPTNGVDAEASLVNCTTEQSLWVGSGGVTLTSVVSLFLNNVYVKGGINLIAGEPSSALVSFIGHLRNCYSNNAYGYGASGRYMFGQNLGTTDKPFIVENCFAYSGFYFSPTTKKVNFITRNNRGYNPLGIAPITVGNSPFTYVNTDSVPEAIYIDGGRVTAIAKNSVNIFTVSPATVWLEPDESLTVTYSGSGKPTMNKDMK